MRWHIENLRNAVSNGKAVLERLQSESQPERYASLLTALSGVLLACEQELAASPSEETLEELAPPRN